MMARLFNKSKNTVIMPRVEVANTFKRRLVGLIGRKEFSEALWIKSCNSIHTWFMQIPIDLAFVDKNLVVRSMKKNVSPWKIVWPVLSASSVFEMPAGTLDKTKTEKGDLLDVDENP